MPFVGRAGKLLETLLGGDRARPRGVFYREHAQVPASGQPRSAAGRDRELPGVPAAPGRADPADGDLHARQLLDQAAARRPDGDHAAARPARGARRSAGAPCGCIRSSIRPPRSTRRACSRRCARTSRACRELLALGAPEQPVAVEPRAEPQPESAAADARATSGDGGCGHGAPTQQARRGRPARAVLDAPLESTGCPWPRSDAESLQKGVFAGLSKCSGQGLKSVGPVADTGPVSIPPGVTTGPRPFSRGSVYFWGRLRRQAPPLALQSRGGRAHRRHDRIPRRPNRSAPSSLRRCATATSCSCAASSAPARRRSCAARRARSACSDPVTSPTFSIGHRYRADGADRLAPRPLPPGGARARGPGAARRLPRRRADRVRRVAAGRRARSCRARALLVHARHAGGDRRSIEIEDRATAEGRAMIVLGFDTATPPTAVALRLADGTHAERARRPRAGDASRPRDTAARDGRRAARSAPAIDWRRRRAHRRRVRPGHLHRAARRHRDRARARAVARRRARRRLEPARARPARSRPPATPGAPCSRDRRAPRRGRSRARMSSAGEDAARRRPGALRARGARHACSPRPARGARRRRWLASATGRVRFRTALEARRRRGRPRRLPAAPRARRRHLRARRAAPPHGRRRRAARLPAPPDAELALERGARRGGVVSERTTLPRPCATRRRRSQIRPLTYPDLPG